MSYCWFWEDCFVWPWEDPKESPGKSSTYACVQKCKDAYAAGKFAGYSSGAEFALVDCMQYMCYGKDGAAPTVCVDTWPHWDVPKPKNSKSKGWGCAPSPPKKPVTPPLPPGIDDSEDDPGSWGWWDPDGDDPKTEQTPAPAPANGGTPPPPPIKPPPSTFEKVFPWVLLAAVGVAVYWGSREDQK